MAESRLSGAPTRQYMLVGLLVLIGAVIAFGLWFAFLRTSYAAAFTGLRTNDAMTIISELDRLKTPYELTDDGSTILVPKDQVNAARINILGGDLPLKGAVGFELFNKTDMGLTEFAQKINYQRALQGELARTIMALDEVESARVHLSLPESGIFEQDRRVAKASVTISAKMGSSIAPTTVRGIQQLVASAVSELQALNVAILDARGQLLSEVPPVLPQEGNIPAEAGTGDHKYNTQIRQALQDAGFGMPMIVDVISQPSPFSGNPDTEIASEDAEKAKLREVPLKIVLVVGSEPGPGIRDRMVAVVEQAVDFDRTRGDSITLSIDPSLGQPRPQPLPTSVRPPREVAMPAENLSMSSVPLWPFAAVIGVFAAIFGISRLRQNGGQLDLAEREAFSARLRSLLDKEMANGKSPA